MPELNDLYVLAPGRSAVLAKQFLDHFAPIREPSFAAEDPSEVLGLPNTAALGEVLRHLENAPSRDYSMYFRCAGDKGPLVAALVFCNDGSLILHLAIAAQESPDGPDRLLLEFQNYMGAKYSYWGWELPPAYGAAEFITNANAK